MFLRQANRVLLCDVGGVVVPFHNGRAEEQLSRLKSEDVLTVLATRQVFSNNAWTWYGTGRITTEEWCGEVRKFLRLTDAVTDEQIVQAVCDVFDPPNSEVLEILQRLRDYHDIPIVAVTNIEPCREKWLGQRFDLWRQFEVVVRSYTVGALKPSLEMFEVVKRLLCEAGLSFDQAVFVDDTRDNVEMAERLGIRSYHFTTPGELHGFLVECGFLAR